MTLDEGVKTIRMSGITKVCQGITTLKEIEGVSIAE
jgi:type II secretory ATPase GspE/PulE/Tfp pilus assembly ATPase PilB-like protein